MSFYNVNHPKASVSHLMYHKEHDKFTFIIKQLIIYPIIYGELVTKY